VFFDGVQNCSLESCRC